MRVKPTNARDCRSSVVTHTAIDRQRSLPRRGMSGYVHRVNVMHDDWPVEERSDRATDNARHFTGAISSRAKLRLLPRSLTRMLALH